MKNEGDSLGVPFFSFLSTKATSSTAGGINEPPKAVLAVEQWEAILSNIFLFLIFNIVANDSLVSPNC